jgi:hypothetical protein
MPHVRGMVRVGRPLAHDRVVAVVKGDVAEVLERDAPVAPNAPIRRADLFGTVVPRGVAGRHERELVHGVRGVEVGQSVGVEGRHRLLVALEDLERVCRAQRVRHRCPGTRPHQRQTGRSSWPRVMAVTLDHS